MATMKMKIRFLLIFVGTLLVQAHTGWAGGPWFVDAYNSGTPYSWKEGYVEWIVDPGGLKGMTHDDAFKLVEGAVDVWNAVEMKMVNDLSVGTAKLKIVAKGTYAYDIVTHDDFLKAVADIKGKKKVLIVFDEEGKIIADHPLYSQQPNLIAATGDMESDPNTLHLVSATIIINGPEVEKQGTAIAKAAIVHEMGHALNLDHTDLNAEWANDPAHANDIPTMYPEATHAAQASLHTDDKVAVSSLYPSADFTSKFCTIKGMLIGSNGKPFQGADTIAYEKTSPAKDARTLVSGVYYAAGVANGNYHLRGIMPTRKYKVAYGEVKNFGMGSSIEPFPGKPVSGFGEGLITAGGGKLSEVGCEKGGDEIVMDTMKLSIPAEGKTLDGSETIPEPSGGGSGGCQLRRFLP